MIKQLLAVKGISAEQTAAILAVAAKISAAGETAKTKRFAKQNRIEKRKREFLSQHGLS
jgi:hypothetical protein